MTTWRIQAKDLEVGDLFLEGLYNGFTVKESKKSTVSDRQVITAKRGSEEIFAVVNPSTRCRISRRLPEAEPVPTPDPDHDKLHQICWQELQVPPLTYEQSSDLATKIATRLQTHYSIRSKGAERDLLDLGNLSYQAQAQIMNALNPSSKGEDFACEADKKAFEQVSRAVARRWVDNHPISPVPGLKTSPEFDKLVEQVSKWVAEHQGSQSLTYASCALLLALAEDVKYLAKKEAERG